jgi:diguanylate cyclase (GGDEF)-like protein/PAS domain S-box-containing protein
MISILSVSIISYNVSKNMLLEQMKEDGVSLSKLATRQIAVNASSLEVINDMLEEKIRIAGNAVIENRQNLSNEYLQQLQEALSIDELHWMNEKGRIIYTTINEYMGWEPFNGHPLYDFILNDDKELMEEIRPDAEFGILLKYGSIKADDGSFVQVGILADHVNTLTERFSYQRIVEDLSDENSIAYAMYIDQSLVAVADSNKEGIGKYHNNNEFKEALNGKISTKELFVHELDSNVLEIAVPVTNKDQTMGILVIGLSMEGVYTSINTIFINSLMITLFMILTFLWVQNRNVIKPVIRLDKNIHEIDIENNIEYRLPIRNNDTFLGLDLSINKILDKTHTYFYQLKENKEELKAYNKEISVAYDQLSSTEEELRVRYDEIQSYAQKLESLKQKYEIAINGTNSAVWEINLEDETIYISQEFKNIIEVPFEEKETVTIFFEEYVELEDKKQLIKDYEKIRNGEIDEIYSQIRIRSKNDKLKWLLFHGKGISDANGKTSYISGIFLDIQKLKEQEEYIEFLAYHDALTGLPNRRSFMSKLLSEMSNKIPGAVMLLDLDNFKGINDMLGHVFGDMVLKKVSQMLMDIANDKIFVSRFGGDEFLILITGEEDYYKIEEYAKKIIGLFKSKLLVENDEVYLSCSLGITTYPVDSSDMNQLIMNADMSMYKVKHLGKNNYMFFDKSMTEDLRKHTEIEKILREAIKSEGFKLVYQPQISTTTGKIIAFEALLRLKNHNISPGIFIPVAEETGMIIEIGRWVTRQAIIQLAKWRETGFEQKPVAINFSAKQLNDEDFIGFLQETLQEFDISPIYLELEITESILVEKTDEIMEFLHNIKNLGMQIALDDFGTGYSSISYLTFVPVDKIKLDKSLNDRFLEIENIKVMDSIISLAHSLNLEVIAEGIEYLEQYKRLRVGGCDYIQGYLFSKPLNVEDIDEIYDCNFTEKIM